MNKKEKQIILDRYELILNTRELGIDKSDSIRELSSLIDALGMKKERYMVENKIISNSKGFSIIVIDAFEMIFESFLKYGCIVKYDIEEVEEAFENVRLDMNADEVNYNSKRIAIIKEYLKNS